MSTYTAETSNIEMPERILSSILDTMPKGLFAVLDGGQFDDLEDELADAGVRSRSLFLEGGDDTMRRDGPWLITLESIAARDHVEKFAMNKPCAVFWLCEGGEQVLWRHLRSINQVLVPDDRILDNDGRAGKPVLYERVLFRHWDPRVISQFLPLFSKEQLSRVFGPANAIIARSADDGRVKRALKPLNLPVAPKGPLKIKAAQISIVSQSRAQVMAERVAEYLQSVAEESTKTFSQQDLMEFSRGSVDEGMKLGITSEGAHCRWAYMNLLSGGRISTSPQVLNVMRADDVDIPPNERVKILMQKMIQELRGG